MNKTLTAIIEREADSYVAHCPWLDIVALGDSEVRAPTGIAALENEPEMLNTGLSGTTSHVEKFVRGGGVRRRRATRRP